IPALPLAIALSAVAAPETEPAPPWYTVKNPWAEPAEAVPKPKPYRLPKFQGGADHYTQIPPLAPSPGVDVDALYRSVIDCYPEPSKFRLDVDLETSYRDRTTYDLTGAAVGQHYVGIVARMPLYSATELNREREREYRRRTDTAKTVGALVKALADRDTAIRRLGLYSSLEARAQVRVAQGVAETGEQVKYLEKVAAAHEAQITAETALIEHRLTLVAQCADDTASQLNSYLLRLTALQTEEIHDGHPAQQN